MTQNDHQALASILQKMTPDGLVNGAGKDAFHKLVQNSMTDAEREMVANVHFAVGEELTNEQAINLNRVFGDEAFVFDTIVLRFIRSYRRPPIVRGDIAAVARRVDSLAKKAREIAHEIEVLDEALHDVTCSGMNLVASGAHHTALEVEAAIEDLRAAMTRLSDARDIGLAATGRRSNAARRRFARDLMVLLHGEGRDLIECVIAGAVEAVEGEIGAGEREWISPLIAAALLPEEPDDET